MNSTTNIGTLFLRRIESDPHAKAIGWPENKSIRALTFSDYYMLIEELVHGLNSVGLKSTAHLSILANTCKEWHVVDLATILLRAVSIPIYPSYTEKEIQYIFNHSDSSFIVVEDEMLLKKVVKIQQNLKNLKVIISIKEISEQTVSEIDNHIKYYTYEQLIQIGKKERDEHPSLFKDIVNSISGNDIASIIYTSGTTGEPKGAVITHHAFATMLNNISLRFKGILTYQKVLTFLPLSHVFGRADSFLPIAIGTFNIYARSIDTIIEDLSEVRPNVMLAVPRIFEKVYTKVLKKIENDSLIKKKIFYWALEASNRYFEKIESDRSPTSKEILEKNLAYKLVFSKIYNRFGGKIKFFCSGGAPLSPDIQKFLRNANLTILEGYGLTETIAPCFINPIYKQIPGTVGTPLNGVEIKFNEDGEILLRTEAMFSNYYKNEEATSEVFEDGWFCTGDIGKLTSEGHLKITDRKKDIIVTSSGKNVAPQKIENLMKVKKHISHFFVIGDQQKYLTAIVGIEKDSFLHELESMELSRDCQIEELAGHPFVIAAVQKEIDEVNLDLARFETIKKFYIPPVEFSVENQHLTPSLKLKKRILLDFYADNINKMYDA